MNIEKQIIGSLLLDPSRIDDMKLINAEMFNDPMLADIFNIYQNADGREINQVVIATNLRSSYWTEQRVVELLAELITEHDSGISDSFCEEKIFNAYKAKKINEIIDHSFINGENIDAFIEDITSAVDTFQKNDDNNVVSIAELTKLSDEYFTEKRKQQYKLGFDSLDKAIGGIDCGDVMIIAARPAVGKSALALQIIRGFGRQGVKVGYFNLEMSMKQVYERSIASASGIDMTRIRLATNFLNDEKELFDKGNSILSEENNVFVISGSQSIAKIRAYQKRNKFQVIVVDYLQLIVPAGNRGNRASEVGDISRGLKAIATDFQIPVIALSQLNRVSDKLKDKEPHMSELRESGDIEQDASIILMLWNSNDDEPTEKTIKIEKSRNGYTDRMVVYFDGKHMKFKKDSETDFEKATKEDELLWD